jgi:hypothetical protein
MSARLKSPLRNELCAEQPMHLTFTALLCFALVSAPADDPQPELPFLVPGNVVRSPLPSVGKELQRRIIYTIEDTHYYARQFQSIVLWNYTHDPAHEKRFLSEKRIYELILGLRDFIAESGPDR